MAIDPMTAMVNDEKAKQIQADIVSLLALTKTMAIHGDLQAVSKYLDLIKAQCQRVMELRDARPQNDSAGEPSPAPGEAP